MNGQRIGYVRVSSLDQNPDRQLEQVPVDRTFADKASGKDVARPQHTSPEEGGSSTFSLMRFGRSAWWQSGK